MAGDMAFDVAAKRMARADEAPAGSEVESDVSRHDRTMGRLCHVIALQCRGTTAVYGWEIGDFVARLRREGIEAVGLDKCPSSIRDEFESESVTAIDDEAAFDTVVVARALEYVPKRNSELVLARAWRRVADKGRLVVCAPNEDGATEQARPRSFNQRRLKNRLKPFGIPKVIDAQPFNWLLMYVEAQGRLGGAVRERLEVTADLCRGRILELGCGEGHLAAFAAERGLDYTGLEMNADKVERARSWYPGHRFIEADMLVAPLDNGPYDTVILAEVLEHVPEDIGARMLSRAWELVSEGGRLIVSVPNEDRIPHRNHIREFGRASFTELVAPYGAPVLVTDQPIKWLMLYVERP